MKRSAALDVRRHRNWLRELLLAPLRLYQRRDLAGRSRRAASTTRPAPHYAVEAVRELGVVPRHDRRRWRLARCNPLERGRHRRARRSHAVPRRHCRATSPRSTGAGMSFLVLANILQPLIDAAEAIDPLLPRRRRPQLGPRDRRADVHRPAADPAAVAEADPLDARAAGARAAAEGDPGEATRTTSSASSRR